MPSFVGAGVGFSPVKEEVGVSSPPELPRKHRRAYSRIATGLRYALVQGYPVRRHKFQDSRPFTKGVYFLTLTSGSFSDVGQLKVHFNSLVKRLRRISRDFEYFRLRTYEGIFKGVLHVVFKGSRLNVDTVRSYWLALHSAWRIDIQMGYGNLKHLTAYLAGYLFGKKKDLDVLKHADFKYGFSKGWFWKGWKEDWRILVDKYPSKKQFVWYWNNWVDSLPKTVQVDLEGKECPLFDKLGWKV